MTLSILEQTINADVPQGSVLVPTLFHLNIHDLLSSISTVIHSYAKDFSLYAILQHRRLHMSKVYASLLGT